MTQSQLRNAIKKMISPFTKETVTDDTVIESVIDDTAGFPGGRLSRVIMDGISYILITNSKTAADKKKYKKRNFKQEDLKLSISDFVSKVLAMLLIIFLPLMSSAQLSVNLGATKTELKNSAISVGIQYVKSLDSLWNGQDFVLTGKRSTFSLTPEVNIQTGNQDAFNGLNAKLTGMFMKFQTTEVDGLIIPDFSRTFFVIPVSIGAESNNLFSNINGIVEAGWFPWYQNSTSGILNKTKIGFFMQGGYKFKVDDSQVQAIGGQKDESLEMPNAAILRLRGSAGIDTKEIIEVNGLKLGLVGNADAWYDIANGALYHKIDLRGRMYLTQTGYLDIVYQKGSGAPNFNQGDQYGVGLTVTF